MLQRPCLKCGQLIASGSYCPRCRPPSSVERLRGRKWQRRRMAVLREANYVCQRCGERIAEEIHHLGPLTDNRLHRLMAVCKPCHAELEAEKRAGSI